MFRHKIEVRFNDFDGMGHVNNAVFLTYLEMARINYFQHVLKTNKINHGFDFILARVSIDYKKPIEDHYVIAEIWVSRIGNTSFDFSYRLVDDNKNIFAEATSVQVSYDYKAKSKVPIPDELRALLDKEKIDDNPNN